MAEKINNEYEILGSNIKLLREEARLTIEEFAIQAGVDVEVVKLWESGKVKPYTKELMVICPILRIHEEDLLERNLVEERQNAYKKMKTGNNRKNFDWYYGSRSKIIFYLLAVILIPLVGLISYLLLKNNVAIEEMKILWKENSNGETNYLLEYAHIIYAYALATICGGVFMIIEVVKRFSHYFKTWYIFLAISLSTFLFTIMAIVLIPFYGYCIYQLVIKKGKNN